VVGHVSKTALISVVIPTRNRVDLLSRCLASLCEQNQDTEFEVLVIDNGSTDQTAAVIREYESRLPSLRGIYAPEPGLHTGRHAGLKAAKGEILVFADDDVEALSSWLSSIREAFKGPGVALVGGNNYPLFVETPPIWLNQLWYRYSSGGYRAITSLSVLEFTGPVRDISPYLVWGCNFAIKRDVLLAAGGFHPDGMPQDLIRFRGDGETHVSRFVAGSGMRAIFHPGASVYHKVTPERMTYEYFRRRGFNQGVSDSYTHLRNQTLKLQENKQPRSSFYGRVSSRVFDKLVALIDSTGVKRAFDEVKRGHKEGYNYHQEQYRNDPEVRDWVHRETYF
jgi:glycosyltransferase involved in cell wall biosynthesis